MSEQRNRDYLLGERHEYWLKELASREQRGELNIQMSNAAGSENLENGESAAVQEQI